MDVGAVSVTQGGAAQPAVGSWVVTAPAEAPGGRVFRRVLHLRFETGGAADGIAITQAAAALAGLFQPLDYNALAPPEPSLLATKSAAGGSVVVTLDAPRQIRSVTFASGAVPGAGSIAEVYRLDGNTLATTPTVSVGVAGVTAALPSGFTDARFAVRLKGPGGTVAALGASSVAGIGVRSYPTGPRLGLAAPDAPETATFFWRVNGEVGTSLPAEAGAVDAADALAAALDRVLGGLAVPLPAHVDVALVVESDAPCTLALAQFLVSYRLLRTAFTVDRQKQSLRFPGGHAVARELLIPVPAGATVALAALDTVESFRPDRASASDAGGPAPDAIEDGQGVALGVGTWVAQLAPMAGALAVTGISLGLFAAAAGSGVVIRLQEDWRGRPAGRTLFEGSLTLGPAGSRRWTTALLPDPLVLPSQPVWLLAGLTRGAAIWLAAPDDATGALLLSPDAALTWTGAKELSGLKARYRLLSRDSAQSEAADPLSGRVGTRVVAPTSRQGDRAQYDLTAAMNEYLAAQDSSGDAADTIPLTLTSSLPGVLTVYPPRIEYDV